MQGRHTTGNHKASRGGTGGKAVRLACAAAVCLCILAAASCGKKKADSATPDNVLVSVGDSVLTLSQVEKLIPVGIDPADSVRMFHNIVDTWVENLVLAEMAENNIRDIDRIDRLTEEYRKNLIVDEYLNTMAEQRSSEVQEKNVKEYFETHRSDFVLQQPLVKGAYIRLDSSDSQLDNIRKWMSQFTEESIDNIERTGLLRATAYEYFRDDWQEWSEIADKIPFRFADADTFVKGNKNFETEADGSVYILHISDYRTSGQEMPYEYARLQIKEMMRSTEINTVRHKLKGEIYRRMVKSGRLKAGSYDPVKGEMKGKN